MATRSGPVEAVLFDFGGVYTGSPFGAIDALGDELGLGPGVLRDLVFGPYDRDTDHPWHRLERGELSMGEAVEGILAGAAARDVTLDIGQVFAKMGSSGGVRETVVQRTRELRDRGYRTGLVTNNLAEFRDGWRGLIPVDDLFEVIVDSSEVGLRKPNPAIYELTLERLGGLAPERAVFLDDFEGNLVAARNVGMHAILVPPDPQPALDELETLLAG